MSTTRDTTKRYPDAQRVQIVSAFIKKLEEGVSRNQASTDVGVAMDSIKNWMYRIFPDQYNKLWGATNPPYLIAKKMLKKQKMSKHPIEKRAYTPRQPKTPTTQMITVEGPTLDDQKKRMALMTVDNCMHMLKTVREMLEG